jgi:hypothetical protein
MDKFSASLHRRGKGGIARGLGGGMNSSAQARTGFEDGDGDALSGKVISGHHACSAGANNNDHSSEFTVHEGKKGVAVAGANRHFLIADPDLGPTDDFELAEGHNVGAVYADKLFFRKLLLDGF